MNILAIGAHFDDIELGCGGTLAKHVGKGDRVTAFVATKSGYVNANRSVIRSNQQAHKEGVAAMKLLGVELICGDFPTFHVEFGERLNRRILSLLDRNRPDRIYTHWRGDAHHDHQAVSKATIHCARHVGQVLMYRSNWYEGVFPFNGNFFNDISGYWNAKEAAIRIHKSEVSRTGGKWLRYFKNEALNAGLRAGVKFCEVFEVFKWKES